MKAVRVWASNSYSPHSQIKKLVWLFLYTSVWGLPSPHFRRNLTDFAPLCFLILHQFTCLTLEFRKFLLLLCSPCIKFAFKIILLYFAGGIWIELLASGKSCSLWVLTNNWLCFWTRCTLIQRTLCSNKLFVPFCFGRFWVFKSLHVLWQRNKVLQVFSLSRRPMVWANYCFLPIDITVFEHFQIHCFKFSSLSIPLRK